MSCISFRVRCHFVLFTLLPFGSSCYSSGEIASFDGFTSAISNAMEEQKCLLADLHSLVVEDSVGLASLLLSVWGCLPGKAASHHLTHDNQVQLVMGQLCHLTHAQNGSAQVRWTYNKKLCLVQSHTCNRLVQTVGWGDPQLHQAHTLINGHTLLVQLTMSKSSLDHLCCCWLWCLFLLFLLAFPLVIICWITKISASSCNLAL